MFLLSLNSIWYGATGARGPYWVTLCVALHCQHDCREASCLSHFLPAKSRSTLGKMQCSYIIFLYYFMAPRCDKNFNETFEQIHWICLVFAVPFGSCLVMYHIVQWAHCRSLKRYQRIMTRKKKKEGRRNIKDNTDQQNNKIEIFVRYLKLVGTQHRIPYTFLYLN